MDKSVDLPRNVVELRAGPLGVRALPTEDGAPGFRIVDVAKLLGCSESQIRSRLRTGALVKSFDPKGQILVRAEDVLKERAELLQRLGASEDRPQVARLDSAQREPLRPDGSEVVHLSRLSVENEQLREELEALRGKVRSMIQAMASSRDRDAAAKAGEETLLRALFADVLDERQDK
jgi:hypothetical protein